MRNKTNNRHSIRPAKRMLKHERISIFMHVPRAVKRQVLNENLIEIIFSSDKIIEVIKKVKQETFSLFQ